MQASSYWREGLDVVIDLLPGVTITDQVHGRPGLPRQMAAVLAHWLPRRLATAWVERSGYQRSPGQSSRAELDALESSLHAWVVRPEGTEGYAKAEVTCGGVATEELSSKTMEAGKVPGLYFIGEVVDVTGHLGGFNFQWAWASGAAAGRAL